MSLLTLLISMTVIIPMNAATIALPSQIDQLPQPSNAPDRSTTYDLTFISAIKEANRIITTRYPKSHLVGVYARLNPQGIYQSTKAMFTNPYRTSDRSIIISMNGGWGDWGTPTTESTDYSVGNKILFPGILTMDASEAIARVKLTYPRGQVTELYIFYPKHVAGFMSQPCYMFHMRRDQGTGPWVVVGMFDKKIAAANIRPGVISSSVGATFNGTLDSMLEAEAK